MDFEEDQNIGTMDVLEKHKFDFIALDKFMSESVPDFEGPIKVEEFKGGQSNPTYKVTDKNRSYVLRRKPPGKLLKSAHAVDREYRVITALNQTDVPVPTSYALCEDENIIGTAFYIMEFMDGRVLWDASMEKHSKEEALGVYTSMNSTMAKLHSVDPYEIGLETFGKPGNYVGRQVSIWTKQYQDSETEEIPEMNKLIEWFPENLPSDKPLRIVHGDFSLTNLMIDKTQPEVIAILDWELSTIGHPLGDLAIACQFFYSDEITRAEIKALGVPEEQALIELYCALTGRSGVDNWAFHIAFCKFRLSAICQGVYKRGLDGNASSQTALEQRPHAQSAAKNGWMVVEGLA